MSTPLSLTHEARFRSKPMRGDAIALTIVTKLTAWQRLLAMFDL